MLPTVTHEHFKIIFSPEIQISICCIQIPHVMMRDAIFGITRKTSHMVDMVLSVNNNINNHNNRAHTWRVCFHGCWGGDITPPSQRE